MQPEDIISDPATAKALWGLIAAACIMAIILWLIESVDNNEGFGG
jgi:hypothetical protein